MTPKPSRCSCCEHLQHRGSLTASLGFSCGECGSVACVWECISVHIWRWPRSAHSVHPRADWVSWTYVHLLMWIHLILLHQKAPPVSSRETFSSSEAVCSWSFPKFLSLKAWIFTLTTSCLGVLAELAAVFRSFFRNDLPVLMSEQPEFACRSVILSLKIAASCPEAAVSGVRQQCFVHTCFVMKDMHKMNAAGWGRCVLKQSCCTTPAVLRWTGSSVWCHPAEKALLLSRYFYTWEATVPSYSVCVLGEKMSLNESGQPVCLLTTFQTVHTLRRVCISYLPWYLCLQMCVQFQRVPMWWPWGMGPLLGFSWTSKIWFPIRVGLCICSWVHAHRCSTCPRHGLASQHCLLSLIFACQ